MKGDRKEASLGVVHGRRDGTQQQRGNVSAVRSLGTIPVAIDVQCEEPIAFGPYRSVSLEPCGHGYFCHDR